MNLFEDEEDELLKQQKKKVKTKGIIIISCIVVAIILIIAIVGVMMYIQSKQWGITIDGKGIAINDSTIIKDEQTGKVYLSLSEIAPEVTGYKYLKGEYNGNSEDTNSGFVQCDGEVVQFRTNENKINKILLQEESKDNEYGYMYLSQKIKYSNGKLYACIDDLKPILNVKVAYDSENNKITIAGAEYLYEAYESKIESWGYKSIDTAFVNKRALASDLIVAKGENNLLGIITPEGKEIVGGKYTSIKYLQTTDEFLVENSDNKFGIISALGQSKFSMKYSSIKLLDKDVGLYIVKINNKYGVINKSEKQIVYPEYDAIGVSKTTFPSLENENKNPALFYTSIIPVEKDEKWGLFNTDGQMVLPVEYDTIGCIATSKNNKSVKNAILLEDYEGIIVGKKLNEEDRENKYAVYNPQGEQLVGFQLDNIFYDTENGKDVYYLEMNGQQGNLEEVFKANGIKKVNVTVNDSDLNNNMEIKNQVSNSNEVVKN